MPGIQLNDPQWMLKPESTLDSRLQTPGSRLRAPDYKAPDSQAPAYFLIARIKPFTTFETSTHDGSRSENCELSK